MDETKLIMLGTGTPNADPRRSGPCVAICIGEKSYLVDCGVGVVRRCVEGYHKGLAGLKANNLSRAFITHLHSDHTMGLPDLILTPWVLTRKEPLELIGPKGLKNMVDNIKRAYEIDINERLIGHEEANTKGIIVNVKEIENRELVENSKIYEDELVEVYAIPVIHGHFEGAYAFKFVTYNKTIVISGDTNPSKELIEASRNCDILVHEVYHTEGLKKRMEHWQKYHSSVHTSAMELGEIAKEVNPKLLVLYHQLYMMDINTYTNNLYEKMEILEDEMIAEIKINFDGEVVSANDLDIF